jgi:N-acetyl-anhydromuramyl-L-alanine amidase AmpD
MEVEILKLTEFKSVGKSKRKKQILLTHTSRNVRDYISGLKYRYNGENKKLPHYVISREGEIMQIIPPDTYSEYLEVSSYNKQNIVVSLENLGWLKKNPINQGYINWIGNIYRDEVYERKWRGYYFWQPYTDQQINSLTKLILKLCEDFNIPKTTIGHNVKMDKIENFNGIVSHSNYYSEKTDLNPSFDFELLKKNIKNEQPI